jgi:hypothetical protein
MGKTTDDGAAFNFSGRRAVFGPCNQG